MIFYAVTFGLLALGTSAFAVLTGGWFAPLFAWLAIAWGVISLAYASNAPALLGKRDGRFQSPWALLVLPHLLLSSSLWRAARLASRATPFHALNSDYFVGRRLLGHEQPAHFASVVDLTAEFQEPDWGEREVLFVPTLDGSAPDARTLRGVVERVRALRAPVFIHCAQGHGRTATFSAALLMAAHGLSLEAALASIGRARPGAKPNRGQRRVLAELEALLRREPS